MGNAELSFGQLLRGHRLAAGLTQEALAELAGVSTRGVQDLERGTSQPHRETLQRLVDALTLSVEERQALVASAAPRPRLRIARESSGNLPTELTSFVGRTEQIAEVGRLLVSTRLVTITGVGGMGKTRLALRVAADVQSQFPEGVWLVELAAIDEPGLVSEAVARALQLRERPGQPAMDTVIESLRGGRRLVLLDNCEHLVDACAAVARALLLACPDLRLLATSREALGVGGEVAWRIPSLSSTEAVQLFVSRAGQHQPGYALTTDNTPTIEQVCAALDGMPLALELAAARLNVLSIEEIAGRLAEPLRLLSTGLRTAPLRQQSLRAAIDWSYDLLSARERGLFDRLAVFSGGWTLAAAEAIDDDVDTLQVLGSLIDKSLVVVEPVTDDGRRYRLLEPLREYAAERLANGEGAGDPRQRHADFFLAMARRADSADGGPDEPALLQQLERDHDNMLAALRWAAETDHGALGVSLVLALARFWSVRGHLRVATHWLGWAEAHAAAGSLALAQSLGAAGFMAMLQGDADAAARHLQASMHLRRALGDRLGTAQTLLHIGELEANRGDVARALRHYEESLKLFRSLEYPRGIAAAVGSLGYLAFVNGDPRTASALLEESLAIRQKLGNRRGQSGVLAALGTVATAQGKLDVARDRLGSSLQLAVELGHHEGIANALDGFGWLAASLDEPARALQLVAAADGLRVATGVALSPFDAKLRERWLANARATLGDEASEAAYALGRGLTAAEATTLALN